MQRITQLWKSGTRGKLLIGCGGLLVLAFIFALTIAIWAYLGIPVALILALAFYKSSTFRNGAYSRLPWLRRIPGFGAGNPQHMAIATLVYIVPVSLVLLAAMVSGQQKPPSPAAIPTPTRIVSISPTPAPLIATATPKPTEVPAATSTPKPTEVPVATSTPKPTEVPVATSTPKPTEVPVATSTPKPTNTPKPTEQPKPTNTPSPVVPTFGEGMKIVGTDMPPGTYRSMGGSYCYWERLRGFGGTLGEIIANDNTTGPAIVTISATDKGFRSSRCGRWTQDLSPITSSPTAPFGDGTFIVNKDIAPGTWRSSGSGTCYWERLKGFSGELGDIIANDNVSGSAVVTIDPGDAGFSSARCGTWTKIN